MTAAASRLLLRPLRLSDEATVRAAHEAMRADPFEFVLEQFTPETAWSDHVALVQRVSDGVGLAPERVRASFLLAEVDGEIVGRTSIRHELNDWLTARGGHVGYGVLPGCRRRGYATEILRQSLVIARSVGVTDVLVTCDDDNVASVAVIERCGGRLDEAWPRADHDGVPVRRYWIRPGSARR